MTELVLDHVNILTRDLTASVRFYEAIGLRVGKRPPVEVPGAWLYSGDQAVVHLIGVDGEIPPPGTVDHFALRTADDPAALIERLTRNGLSLEDLPFPKLGLRLIRAKDPSGVTVEFNFTL